MSGWSTCKNCHQRIWWGSAPFDSSRNWPFDDQDEQSQHFDTCAAVDRVVDQAGTAHRVSKCRACGERVWWTVTARGKRRPMNIDVDALGDEWASDVCHFDTCLGEPASAEPEAVPVYPSAPTDIEYWLSILGLTYPATLQQVTTSFRGLAMRHHPDMGGDAQEFIRVRLAFDRCKELMGAAA